MAIAKSPSLGDTCLSDYDKEVLQAIITKTEDYNKRSHERIEIYLTGSSIADSDYNDVDLVVVSKSHKQRDLAYLIGKWVEERLNTENQKDDKSTVFDVEKYDTYSYMRTGDSYRIKVKSTSLHNFDITAGKTLEEALVDRNRKYIKVTS